LARAPTDQRLTRTGTVMGSPYYISPEQIRGTSALDARTDIYSIGVVLYELATGQKPFDEHDAFSTMKAHVEQMPVPPSEIDPALPPALNEIILTALSKEPEHRFSSADLFGESLERVKVGLGSTPIRRSWASYFSSCLGSSRTRRVGAGTLTLLLSIALGGDVANDPIILHPLSFALPKPPGPPSPGVDCDQGAGERRNLRPLHSSNTRDTSTVVPKYAPATEVPQREWQTRNPSSHRAIKKSHGNIFLRLFDKIAHPHRHAREDQPDNNARAGERE